MFKRLLEKYKIELKKAFNELKSMKTFYKQIPNLLSASRFTSPFVVIPLVLTGNLIPAAIATGIYFLTDAIDGPLARKLKVTSKLGKDLDAVSDKFLYFSLILPLTIIQSPIYLVNIALESIIAATNLRAKIKNKNPETIKIGKIKMWGLGISTFLGYANLVATANGLVIPTIISNSILYGVFGATVGLQIATAYKYIKINNNKNKILENDLEQNISVEIESEEKEENKENVKTLENTYSKEAEIQNTISAPNYNPAYTNKADALINNIDKKIEELEDKEEFKGKGIRMEKKLGK